VSRLKRRTLRRSLRSPRSARELTSFVPSLRSGASASLPHLLTPPTRPPCSVSGPKLLTGQGPHSPLTCGNAPNVTSVTRPEPPLRPSLNRECGSPPGPPVSAACRRLSGRSGMHFRWNSRGILGAPWPAPLVHSYAPVVRPVGGLSTYIWGETLTISAPDLKMWVKAFPHCVHFVRYA